jgi:predicted nucleotidyltransferase
MSRLRHLHELAARTGKVKRFLVFGSFVSDTPTPRDIDVALVMATDFRLEDAPRESQTLFSHADAEARFGASVFWVREGMLSDAMMLEFLDTWQTKRDGTRRGIVEVQA